MADPSASVHEGRCACGNVRYRMFGEPMFVHCCHCTWCQRETGSAFAVNALIEADRVEVVRGEVEVVVTPTASGKGQRISRCPDCRVALWYNYGGSGDVVRFVRVGTLLEPGRVPPDVHIFTATKLPWVRLPEDVPVFDEYYSSREHWPEASLRRREALIARLTARSS